MRTNPQSIVSRPRPPVAERASVQPSVSSLPALSSALRTLARAATVAGRASVQPSLSSPPANRKSKIQNLKFLPLLLLPSLALAADETKPTLKPQASVTHYVIAESNPFFSDQSRTWMETTVKFGGKLTWKPFVVEVMGAGMKTSLRDPFGTGSGRPDDPGAPDWRETTPDWDLDTAYLQWTGTETVPLKLTVGRQPIVIGTEFLIGDGVYDGYHRNAEQVVYSNARRWFDAARLEFDLGKTHFDALAWRVDRTWDADGGDDGWVAGLDVSREFTEIKGKYAIGIFYRDSPSNHDNDMGVFNFRAEQRVPGFEDFYVSGEYAHELGRAASQFYVTEVGGDLSENAWHAELGWQDSKTKLKPFAEAGYVYYSEDFTPFAQGFHEWGKWYLGNQIDWIIFSTNTKIVRAKIGFWPHEKVKLSAHYHNTRLVSGPGGTLSDEVCAIAEWFPTDKIWVNLMVSYAMPGSALAKSGLGNSFSYLNAGAVTVGTHDSVDMVLAMGISF